MMRLMLLSVVMRLAAVTNITVASDKETLRGTPVDNSHGETTWKEAAC